MWRLPAWLMTGALVMSGGGCFESTQVCEPRCGEARCGPDPACGLSCGDCARSETCEEGVCVPIQDEEPARPDAGTDAGADPGPADDGGVVIDDADTTPVDEDPEPCTNPEPDCSVPKVETPVEQGLDGDLDGWGACCDCDDDDATTNPGEMDSPGDGTDNDCNGLVDEPGGKMVRVPAYPGRWIDVYETTVFANADCTGERYGESVDDYPAGWPPGNPASETLYACSLPGLVPSGHLTWYRARRACEAQGKRLCERDWWKASCWNSAHYQYPYGADFRSGVCNDALGGTGAVAPAGSHTGCRSLTRVYDLSGNLNEWLQTVSDDHPGFVFTGGFSSVCELHMAYGGGFVSCDDIQEPWLEESVQVCLDCIPGDSHFETLPPETLKPYLGARCCFQE